MTVQCWLDQMVHRTIPFDTPLQAAASDVIVTFKFPSPTAANPVLRFDFGGGNVVDIQCTGESGIKPPQNRDCVIAAKGSAMQWDCCVDDGEEWVCILGTELSTDPNHSVYLTNRTDLTNGQTSDFFVYSAKATASKTAVSGSEIPASGPKVPPTVGPAIKFHTESTLQQS